MKKLISLALILLSASIYSFSADAQSTTNEITIKLKDGKVLNAYFKSVSPSDVTVSPGDIESITISSLPASSRTDKQIPLKLKEGRLLIDGDSIVFSKSPLSFNSIKMRTVYLGVQTSQDDKGAKIEEVVSGSPAEKAGLMKDDIITNVEGENIDGPETLAKVIRGMKPDQKVKISILRDGQKKEVSAVLGVQDAMTYKNTPFQFIDSMTNGRGFHYFYNMPNPYGRNNPLSPNRNFRVQPIPRGKSWGFPPEKKAELGLQIQDTQDENGVSVLKVESNSPAEKAGIKKGDLLTQINENKITNINDAMEELSQATGNEYKLQVMRNKKPVTITVKIPKELRKADI